MIKSLKYMEPFDGIYFKGNTDNCVKGALNELEEAGGGKIIQIGIHPFFVPENAAPDDQAGNRGKEYDAYGNLIDDAVYGPIRAGDALRFGKDITDIVKAKYGK